MSRKNKDALPEQENAGVPETETAAETAAEPEKEPGEGGSEEQAAQPARDYEAELAEEKDKYLRLAAEYDNYRRRSQKEREALFADVRADTVKALLPVYDNLERALKTECSDEAFYRGVELTMNQLLDILGKMGVTLIETGDCVFDPQLHNAVMHVEDESLGENVIVEEFQKGFKLNDKVIRFAMVKVAN